MKFEKLITLKNGEQIYIRDLRPEDKTYLASGMSKLSHESIQHRFFVAKKGLSESELKTLTEFDEKKHVAIAAMDYPNLENGYAVARFNIDDNNSTSAEFAILIIDPMQGKGLGKIMLYELIEIAKSRDIRLLHGQLKSTNTAMIALAVGLVGVKSKIIPEGQGVLRLELSF